MSRRIESVQLPMQVNWEFPRDGCGCHGIRVNNPHTPTAHDVTNYPLEKRLQAPLKVPSTIIAYHVTVTHSNNAFGSLCVIPTRCLRSPTLEVQLHVVAI